MNRTNNNTDQATKEMHRKHEHRHLLLTNAPKNRHEQMNLSKQTNPQAVGIKYASVIVLTQVKNNKSLDSKSYVSSRGTQQPITPRETFIDHPFFNVYNGMPYEEWTKTRDAFVAAYFKE
ncbi:unnamed protein product [Rotaria socialis]|uniref:Uncharacterized protein n=1 Tax=Rotaria socialis TaxID=392032 RepID=A0A820A9E0_9BILA|nr:unnamed protein product [Rotaria socialis]CAF3442320.1 unnamed protein product [Rotaria socialis]CAF3557187.1 unnamed protein product [Rotaria socialis]CAF3722183.1 unnamed protein product [Rotaria socialis]CAF3810926.1 unnamed protein product [Rotaria socialis]